MTSPVIDAAGDRPLVLLPIRLETSYTPDRQALRVRIFPDEIHIDAFDQSLTAAEVAAGEAYWRAVWAGSSAEAALAGFARSVQRRRAAWVLDNIRPVNAGERPQPPRPSPEPQFVTLASLETPPRPPLARGLPDFFVAVLLADETALAPVSGRLIPRELPIGPTPGQRVTLDAAGLSLGEGTRWLVDYDAAVDVGMAITLPAPVDVAGAPLQLFVFGVRSDGSGLSELDALMTAHRFATGLEFLAVGTPTNNTEKDRSAWRRDAVPAVRPDSPPDEAPDADGPLLSEALGLSRSVFSGLPGAAQRSQPLARAARTALWPATFGMFLDNAVDLNLDGTPILSDATRESLRDTYEGSVIGRGPLPSVRIGRQPYGVLPVMATRKLNRTPIEVVGVPRRFQDVLQQARVDLSANPTPTAFTNLLDVLGSAPVLMGLRMRALLPSLDQILAPIVIDPFGFGGTAPSSAVQAQNAVAEEYGLNFGRFGAVEYGSVTRPLLLPLVHDSDAAYLDALRVDRQRSIASVLQGLLEVGRATEAWPQQAAVGDVPIPPEWPAADDADALRLAAAQLAALNGVVGTGHLSTYQPIRSLVPKLPHLHEAIRQESQVMTDEALQVWARAGYRSLGFDEAAAELAAAPSDQRQIAVAEALDCVSHRLDAWITSMATERLGAIRSGPPTGLTLGAYGWLESVPSPGAKPPKRGGYIHAPSQTQAVTAGVLRSANLAHSASGAFAVDLSSERVRTGLQILDAVRQGQSLGAVIGYRVERALAEAGLQRFIFSLRVLAPSTSGGSADQALAFPSSVVDGVRLLEIPRDEIHFALQTPPPQNPFLAGHWNPPTAGELDPALDQAASAYDAAADLMLAESVHQLVSGNLSRASTLLDAAGAGAAAPPDPEFPRTPTVGVPLTHRVVVLTGVENGAIPGWAADAPRAQTEPRLERWAQARLGPASAITLRAGVTLDSLAVCALDVVYAASDAPTLEGWLRALDPAAGAAAEPFADPAALLPFVDTAIALRTVVASARPMTAEQLRSPRESSASRTEDLAELAGRLRAAAGRLDGAGTLGEAAQRRLLTGFGIGVADLEIALTEAKRRVTQVGPMLAAESPALDQLDEAAEILFGPGFVVLPLLVPAAAADDFTNALGQARALKSQIRGFLRDASTVRAALTPYVSTLLYADVAGRPVPLRVAQLRRTAEPATGWVALPFAANNPPPDAPVTSLIVESPAELTGTQVLAGMVVDEWVEVIPRQRLLSVQAGQAQPKRRPPMLASGVAVHADAPGARPPQSILVAVTPDGGGWSTERLTETLVDTLQLARLRLVTLERSTRLGYILPAALYPAFSLHGERILDFKQLTEMATDVPVPFVKEGEEP